MKADAMPADLIFDWPRGGGFPFALAGFLACSLVAHVATFFLFQVADHHGVSLPRTAPRISVLGPDSAESAALLRWIDAEDPALLSSGAEVVPPRLAAVRYHPSFETPRTRLLAAPTEKAEPVPYPPAQDSLAFIESVMPVPMSAVVNAPPRWTEVTFSNALTSRLRREPAAPAIPQATSAVPPAQWLVGVNGRGEVRYLFLQRSSTDAALDQSAATYLRQLDFAPSGEEIAWSLATFHWGGARPPAP